MKTKSDYRNYTDPELVEMLKSGHHPSFTEIYDRYWAILFRHSRQMLRDDMEAGDVVQDVFTILWNKADEISISTSLSSYLYAAVRNRTLDAINRTKVREKYVESLSKFLETDNHDLNEDLIMKDLIERIDRSIEKLPAKMRILFEMSRKEHLSQKEIAEKLDISETTVKKQIGRAIKILRLRFELILIGVILFFS